MKAPKVLRVSWVDSTTLHSWQHEPYDCLPAVCESVGYLVSENKVAITLALNSAPDTASPYGHLMIIPKAVILKRKVLK